MKKSIAGIGALFALVAVAFVFSLSTSPNVGDSNLGVSDEPEYQGLICLEIEKLDGTYPLGCFHNEVTNILKNMSRDVWLGSGTADVTLDYLQLSTDGSAPSATDMTCPSPVTTGGLGIAQGATAIVTTSVGNMSVYKKWTASDTVSNIQKLCLHNGSSSGGQLMASSLFTAVTLYADENISATYYPAQT